MKNPAHFRQYRYEQPYVPKALSNTQLLHLQFPTLSHRHKKRVALSGKQLRLEGGICHPWLVFL
jgi:hypothetical protein